MLGLSCVAAEPVTDLDERELFGASWKGEGPLPLKGVAPQSQPLYGMLPRPSTNICPKDLTRDMRGFFNSRLAEATERNSQQLDFDSSINCE